MTLVFLPPYSPQLAPVERVWKLTRRLSMHNHYFANLGDVLSTVTQCFFRGENPMRRSNEYAALLKSLCLMTVHCMRCLRCKIDGCTQKGRSRLKLV